MRGGKHFTIGGNISQLKRRAAENTLARQEPVRYTIVIKNGAAPPGVGRNDGKGSF